MSCLSQGPSAQRYPKRKRAEIKYAEPDANDDSGLDSGTESDTDSFLAEMQASFDDMLEEEADPNFGSRKKVRQPWARTSVMIVLPPSFLTTCSQAKTATPKGKRPYKKKAAPPRKPKPFEFM
jgi:hypothetical protein